MYNLGFIWPSTICHVFVILYGLGSFLTHHNSNYRSIMIWMRNLILRFKTPEPSVQWITWLLQIKCSEYTAHHPGCEPSYNNWDVCIFTAHISAKCSSAWFQNLLSTSASVLYLALTAMWGWNRKPKNKFPRWGEWKQNTDTLCDQICWWNGVSMSMTKFKCYLQVITLWLSNVLFVRLKSAIWLILLYKKACDA